jgi:hypothetical protein
VKRRLPFVLTAFTFLIAGVLYGQSRDRSRSYERSSRSLRGFSDSSSSSNTHAATTPATNSSSRPAAYEAPSSGRSLPGEYVLLSRKSIFASDRHAYVERPRDYREPPKTETAPAPPPAVPVLVGVLIGDNDLIAYIEDPDTGKLWPLAAGDPLPGTYGTVVHVTLDDITIAAEGGPEHRILIGQNLAGENAASRTLSSPSYSSSGSSASTSTTAPAATGPALDPNEPGISIEEKMRRRRLQQLGK